MAFHEGQAHAERCESVPESVVHRPWRPVRFAFDGEAERHDDPASRAAERLRLFHHKNGFVLGRFGRVFHLRRPRAIARRGGLELAVFRATGKPAGVGQRDVPDVPFEIPLGAEPVSQKRVRVGDVPGDVGGEQNGPRGILLRTKGSRFSRSQSPKPLPSFDALHMTIQG